MQYKLYGKTYNVTAHKTKYLCDDSLAVTLEDSDTEESAQAAIDNIVLPFIAEHPDFVW